jgi:hypothetical protein
MIIVREDAGNCKMMFVEKCFECLYLNKVEELHKEMNVYT